LFQFQSVLHRIHAIKFQWHLMCLSSHLTMLITLILIVDLVPLSLPCCYNRHKALLEIFLMQNFNQEHLFLSCLLTWYRQRIPSNTSQYWWSLTPHQLGSCKIFNVPIELNSFENVFKKYYWWLNQIPLSMYQGLHILHYTWSGTFSLFWGCSIDNTPIQG